MYVVSHMCVAMDTTTPFHSLDTIASVHVEEQGVPSNWHRWSLGGLDSLTAHKGWAEMFPGSLDISGPRSVLYLSVP